MQEIIRCGAMGIMYVIAVATNVQIMPAIRKKDILFAGLNLGICTICMSSMFRGINANSFELMVIAILGSVGGCIYLWAEKRINSNETCYIFSNAELEKVCNELRLRCFCW